MRGAVAPSRVVGYARPPASRKPRDALQRLSARARTAKVQPVALLLRERHALVILGAAEEFNSADDGARPRDCAPVRIFFAVGAAGLAPAVVHAARGRHAAAGAALRRAGGAAGAERPRAATPSAGHAAPHRGRCTAGRGAPAAGAMRCCAATTSRAARLYGVRTGGSAVAVSQRGRSRRDASRALTRSKAVSGNLARPSCTCFLAAAARARSADASRARKQPPAVPGCG